MIASALIMTGYCANFIEDYFIAVSFNHRKVNFITPSLSFAEIINLYCLMDFNFDLIITIAKAFVCLITGQNLYSI